MAVFDSCGVPLMGSHANRRVWETRELPGRDPLARKIVVPFPVESPLSGRGALRPPALGRRTVHCASLST